MYSKRAHKHNCKWKCFSSRKFKCDIVQWKGARNLHISQFYLTISFLNIKPIVKVAQIAIAATSLELHLINFRFNLNVSINVELDCVYVNVILSLQCLDGAGQFSELFCILWKCLTMTRINVTRPLHSADRENFTKLLKYFANCLNFL